MEEHSEVFEKENFNEGEEEKPSLTEREEELNVELLNQLEDTIPQRQALMKSEKVPFDCTRVETWGAYIEQLDQEITHEELYKKLRTQYNLEETKGLRCLLKLLDCVVIWAERSQSYYVAGKDWKQEGNLYQGQLLLDTLRDTINEFVSRLGPYQVFHNQESKTNNLRREDLPEWKRVPYNGAKIPENEKNNTRYPVGSTARELTIVCVPDVINSPTPAKKSRRRTMADLKK